MTKTLSSREMRNFCDEKTRDWMKRYDFDRSMMKSLMMISWLFDDASWCYHLLHEAMKYEYDIQCSSLI